MGALPPLLPPLPSPVSVLPHHFHSLPLVPLLRVEFHLLGLEVSISPLVTLISFRIDVDSSN